MLNLSIKLSINDGYDNNENLLVITMIRFLHQTNRVQQYHYTTIL